MVHAIALAVVLQVVNVAGVPPSTLEQAQTEVARVFRDIGVNLEWSRTASPSTDRSPVIRIVLVAYETGELQQRTDTVMGAAVRTTLGTGVAYVFYRRVESEAARHAVPVASVLACAMAHELGHLLLPNGVQAGHSPAGLMRACWNRGDFHRAEQGLLRFSSDQADLIRSALRSSVSALPALPAPPALPAISTPPGNPATASSRGSCSPPAPPTSQSCR
jgi:hypothetical protein